MAKATVASRATARSAATTVYDEGLRRFMSNVMFTMGMGLLITGIVGGIVVSNPDLLAYFITKGEKGPELSGLWVAISLGELALVWVIGSWREESVGFISATATFAFYAALNGLTMAPVLSLYTGASVMKVFFIAASTFGACALWGHTTKRDITGMGAFLIMGLLGLLLAMVVNIFLRSTTMDFVICSAGVLIFAGFTAWDMQMLRNMYDEEGSTASLVVNGALALYLDFVNLFLFFLNFFGAKDD